MTVKDGEISFTLVSLACCGFHKRSILIKFLRQDKWCGIRQVLQEFSHMQRSRSLLDQLLQLQTFPTLTTWLSYRRFWTATI